MRGDAPEQAGGDQGIGEVTGSAAASKVIAQEGTGFVAA